MFSMQTIADRAVPQLQTFFFWSVLNLWVQLTASDDTLFFPFFSKQKNIKGLEGWNKLFVQLKTTKVSEKETCSESKEC